jgi:hypothetical protein
MEKEKVVLAQTVKMERIIGEVEATPYTSFDRWPILEIRKKCVESLKNQVYLDTVGAVDWRADWIEDRVDQLLNHRGYGYELVEEILSLYIFNSHRDSAVRALEFLVSRCSSVPIVPSKLSLKLIAGKLAKDDSDEDLYASVSGLWQLLDKSFVQFIECRGVGDYYTDRWISLERVFKIILQVSDYSFLPRVNEILTLMKEKLILPKFFGDPLAFETHRDRLRAVKKYLEKAKKKALEGKEID